MVSGYTTYVLQYDFQQLNSDYAERTINKHRQRDYVFHLRIGFYFINTNAVQYCASFNFSFLLKYYFVFFHQSSTSKCTLDDVLFYGLGSYSCRAVN